jgi:hypothetical protein
VRKGRGDQDTRRKSAQIAGPRRVSTSTNLPTSLAATDYGRSGRASRMMSTLL